MKTGDIGVVMIFARNRNSDNTFSARKGLVNGKQWVLFDLHMADSSNWYKLNQNV